MRKLIIFFMLFIILIIGCNVDKSNDFIIKKFINNEEVSVSRKLISENNSFYSIETEFIENKYYDLLITKLDDKLNTIQKKRTNLNLHFRTIDIIDTPNEFIFSVLYSPISNMTTNECGVLKFNKNDFNFSLNQLPNMTNSKFFKMVENDGKYNCIIKNYKGEMKLLKLSKNFTEIATNDLIENFSNFITVNDENFTFVVLDNELVVSKLTTDFSKIINSKRNELGKGKFVIIDIISNNGILLIALKENNSKQIQIVRLTESLDNIRIEKINASSLAFCKIEKETFFSIITEKDDLKVEIKRINPDFSFEPIKSYALTNYQVINYLNYFNNKFFIGGSVYINNNFHSIIYTLR